jgi:hypothetical protein
MTTDDIPYPEGWYIPKKDYHFYDMYYMRYGRCLAANDCANIIKQIESGQAVLIKKPEGRYPVFGVRVYRKGHGWRKVVVLYDEAHKTLVSALPYNKRGYGHILWPLYQKADKVAS